MSATATDSEILIQHCSSFDCITVELLPHSTRIIPQELYEVVEQTWSHYLEESHRVGRNVWDGLLYRFENCERQERGLCIRCSTIQAKDAISFRLIGGRSKYPQETWAQNMFLGSLVHSSDGFALFGVPSGKTTATRPFDLVGGVLSADEIQLASGKDLACLLYNELNEELNIEEGVVQSVALLGIVRTRTSSVGLIADCQLAVSAAEVRRRFAEKNDGELREIKTVPLDELQMCLIQGGGHLPLVWQLKAASEGLT
ncbi:MAG: hypothetical protein QY326_03925 [Bdellovibrionota bacterium]|nr:MAG: hypothetical protein QY326_03925 [Bdellovibrionota bacterium]